MRDFMMISKAMADETRVRILMALAERELCVCQIIEMLGLAPSTVSKHLQLLNQARLVNARKDKRWVYYSLSGKEAPLQTREALKWVSESLRNNPQIGMDRKSLAKILKVDPEELCKAQAAR